MLPFLNPVYKTDRITSYNDTCEQNVLHSYNKFYLAIKSDNEEHEKEENCPYLGKGELRNCLRVSDE